jgi:hypothetical protein
LIGKRLAELLKRFRRQFLGLQFDKQGGFAHFFTIGKPSRSRDS